MSTLTSLFALLAAELADASADRRLDLVNGSSGEPLVPASALHAVLFALTSRALVLSAAGEPVAVHAYDGLGDVSRGDARRTWVMIDISAPRLPVDEVAGLTAPLRGYGARVTVDAREGHGATVVLQLPRDPRS
jgi:1,6-anhydro-N-acetylmuramate kinase